MKGITPVIAIILLLMITIAMVGFAFVWFSGVMGTITNQTGATLSEEQRQIATNIRIANAYSNLSGTVRNVLITFTNTGTQSVKASELVMTVEDSTAGRTLGTSVYANSIAPGATVTDYDSTFDCTQGDSMTITARLPKHVDSVTFTC